MLQIASLQTAGPRGVQAFAGTALHAGVRQLVSGEACASLRCIPKIAE